MTRHELKKQKSRLETTWLRLKNEIDEVNDMQDGEDKDMLLDSLEHAKDGVGNSIGQLNYMIGQTK